MRPAWPVLAALAVLLAGCAASTGTSTSSAGGAPTARGTRHSGPAPLVITSLSPIGAYRGMQLDPPQPRPAFTLTDSTGRRYDFAAQTAGRPTFLFFGYTHCPDVCPTTMADVAVALRESSAGLRRQVRVVFVTTDPARDTGRVLTRWLRRFDTGLPVPFIGLTGSVAQVQAAQVAARVPVASDGGKTHSAELLAFGADDYAHVVYLDGSSPEDIRQDLPSLTRT